MEHCMTQLPCQGLYVQSHKECLLLWTALSDHALRRPIGIDHQGLLNTSQAFRQEVYPDRKVAGLEPQQHDADQRHGHKEGEGMDKEFALRPVIGRPPPPGPPALADAEHRLPLRLAPVGHHHALGVKLSAVRKEDRLTEVVMLDGAFLALIPLPTHLLHLLLVQTQGKGKERLEPVVSYQLRDRALDRLLRAGTMAGDGLLDGGLQGEEFLFGFALQEVQRTDLLAIQAGAEAPQQLSLDP